MNDEIKVKNDYNLINALLEDGSESAILKLKMIVDFEDFRPTMTVSGPYGRVIGFDNNIEKINDNNIGLFLQICGKKLVEEWVKDDNDNLLSLMCEIKRCEIKKSLSNMGIDFSHLEKEFEQSVVNTKPTLLVRKRNKCIKQDDDFDDFLTNS